MHVILLKWEQHLLMLSMLFIHLVLMHYLNHNEPVIVLVGVEHLPYGDFGTHAVTICSLRSPTTSSYGGFENDEILYIDTAFGQEVRLDIMIFLRAWHSRGRRGIVVW